MSGQGVEKKCRKAEGSSAKLKRDGRLGMEFVRSGGVDCTKVHVSHAPVKASTFVTIPS